MGLIRKAFEFTAPRAGEYLGRLEDQWAFEDIATTPARIFEGSIPAEVRSTYARELIHSSGGMRLQPGSAEENEALTMAFKLRFAKWVAYYNELSSYDLETGDPDHEWQQTRLDQVDRILQGYVNLIVATNLDRNTFQDDSNLNRVNQFLFDNFDEIIRAFESNGGAPAFYAKTKGLDLSAGTGRELFTMLSERDQVIFPTHRAPNGRDASLVQRTTPAGTAFFRGD